MFNSALVYARLVVLPSYSVNPYLIPRFARRGGDALGDAGVGGSLVKIYQNNGVDEYVEAGEEVSEGYTSEDEMDREYNGVGDEESDFGETDFDGNCE